MPPRAKLPPGQGKRVPLNMRTTRDIRARLEQEAADSGRSLVQEVEHRLESSFANEGCQTKLTHRDFGGQRAYALAKAIAALAGQVEDMTGAGWADDPFTLAQFKDSIGTLLDALAPTRREAVPLSEIVETLPPAVQQDIGPALARGWLDQIRASARRAKGGKNHLLGNRLRIAREIGPTLAPLLKKAGKE